MRGLPASHAGAERAGRAPSFARSVALAGARALAAAYAPRALPWLLAERELPPPRQRAGHILIVGARAPPRGGRRDGVASVGCARRLERHSLRARSCPSRRTRSRRCSRSRTALPLVPALAAERLRRRRRSCADAALRAADRCARGRCAAGRARAARARAALARGGAVARGPAPARARSARARGRRSHAGAARLRRARLAAATARVRRSLLPARRLSSHREVRSRPRALARRTRRSRCSTISTRWGSASAPLVVLARTGGKREPPLRVVVRPPLAWPRSAGEPSRRAPGPGERARGRAAQDCARRRRHARRVPGRHRASGRRVRRAPLAASACETARRAGPLLRSLAAAAPARSPGAK